MRKFVAVAAGAVALGSMAFISSGQASSDNGTLDVSGQTYSQAVRILKSQRYRPVFGGSFGSDVPQAQCIVESQKMLPMARVSLNLNCTRAAQPAPGANAPVGTGMPGGPPGAPHVGSNGVTTVTPTPVGPQPGMSVPGG
ncbi:MAG: hypothetical protein QOH57_3314 [Mycobacterium sp.]|nr:hypothetical protein [Mycobacterium sp.]